MRIVITGASGFIGQQIIPVLQQQDVDLLLVGRNPKELKRQFSGLDSISYDALAQKGRGADILLHLAVLNNDKFGDEEEFHAVNVTLLKQVVSDCQSAGIAHLIYTSTLHENTADTPYGRTKGQADVFLASLGDMIVSRLRLPAVYGDHSFKGKLGILNRIPTPLRGFAFQVLRSLKPTVNVTKIAHAVIRLGNSECSTEEILTDAQKGNWVYSCTKKLIDISFALGVIFFFWWLLLATWIVVKLTSKGPGLLAQKRVGAFGKLFTLYKFRTMEVGTKQAGTHEVSQTSITRVGHFLRKSKIDELPQVWNILKGEMSLVGPRPCLAMQKELVEERNKRGVLEIRPGITGYAQVQGVAMNAPVRLVKLDAEYVKLRTTPLDLMTILRTVNARASAHKPPE